MQSSSLVVLRASAFIPALICVVLGIKVLDSVWHGHEASLLPLTIDAVPPSHDDPWQQDPDRPPCPPFGGFKGGPINAIGGGGSNPIFGGTESGACPPVNFSMVPLVLPDPCAAGGIPPFYHWPEGEAGGASGGAVGTPSSGFSSSPGFLADPPGGGPNESQSDSPPPQLDSPFVDPASGKLVQSRVDLALPGGVLGFQLGRIYRSDINDYQSFVGTGWELNVVKRIHVDTPGGGAKPVDFALVEGNGLQSGLFAENLGVTDWFGNSSRDDQFKFIAGSPNVFIHYLSDGIQEEYTQLDANQSIYYLTEAYDQFGNAVTYKYRAKVTGEPTNYTLNEVVDDLGRSYEFSYDTTDGHGRLESVVAKSGSTTLTRVDYAYEIGDPSGEVLLTSVTRGDIPTEDTPGNVLMVRAVEKYHYDTRNDALASYGGYRLEEVENGKGEKTVRWDYNTDGTIYKQFDRPGGVNRGHGVHEYNYVSATETVYFDPDGEKRTFKYDSYGRITERIEWLDATTTLSTKFTWQSSSCTGCAKIEKVEYPDGSYLFFGFDGDGNLTDQWWYPKTGSSLSPRVERWVWSPFNPSNGEMRTRLLTHELRRDAHPAEDPANSCNHPACTQIQNASGHIVHQYAWSSDEKKLESIDYGSIQSSTQGTGTNISRSATFTYHSTGRLWFAREFQDGTEVGHIEQVLDTGSDYVASRKIKDSVNGDSWTTTYERSSGSFFLTKETDHAGIVSEYVYSDGGFLYITKENVAGASAQRTTSLFFDAAGQLVKSISATADGLQSTVAMSLDESGFPYEVKASSRGGPNRISKFEFSTGSRLNAIEDWRGWRTETDYGFGSLGLPIKVTEKDAGSATRVVWEAGDGGSDDGYDDMGRLTSWRNVAGWKSYRQFDDRGRLKYTFSQSDATHYDARAFNYDVRGFIEEVEVGTLDGDPLSFTLNDLTWLQHKVYPRNLAGHILEQAVYESGNTNEARFSRFERDGRGRVTRKTTYQGDRSGSGTPVPVVAEFDYDAFDRILQARYLESSASFTSISIEDWWYDDANLKATVVRTLNDGSGGSDKTKEEFEWDSLGKMKARSEVPWDGTSWGTARTWDYSYDDLGALADMEDPTGIKREWVVNDLGDVTKEKLTPSGAGASLVTDYLYDNTTGLLSSVTDPEGKVTSYVYHADWDRLQKVTYPDGRFFRVNTYDALGRQVENEDSRGVKHTHTYDYRYLTADTVTKPSGGGVPGPDGLSWVYDRDKGTPTFSRVWENGVKVWETEFTHNDLGELLSETQGIGTDAMTWDMTYGYAGELLRIDYPSSVGIGHGEFLYDTSGRVDTVKYFDGGGVRIYEDSLAYEGFRLSGRDENVSGIEVLVGYDDFGRLDNLEWEDSADATLDGQHRVFDLGDRVTSRQRLLSTKGDVFVHDAYGRMEKWYSGVTNATSGPDFLTSGLWENAEHYTLTKVFGRDEVIEEVNLGSSTTTTTRDYLSNNAHAYTSVDGQAHTITDGRLNSDGTHYFRWDPWGRLAEVENISTSVVVREHRYDAEGRRVQTVEPSDTRRLAYWGARLAVTFTEGATVSDLRTYGYVGGADSEAFVEVSASGAANGSYAIARDAQGSILALIDRSNESVVERYRYGAFGQVSIEDGSGTALSASAYGNDRFFLGRKLDLEVGIYDLRARWYSAERGSFLSPDPLGAVDSWNMYQYGFATPGTWMDPFGLTSILGGSEGPITWYTSNVSGRDVAIGADGSMRDFTDVAGADFDWDDGVIIDDEGLVEKLTDELRGQANQGAEDFLLGMKILGEVMKGGLKVVIPFVLGDLSDACVVMTGYDLGGNKQPRLAGVLGLVIGGAAQWSRATSALGGKGVRYGPLNRGPLPDGIANTSRGGSYTGITVHEATTLYRVHGGTAGELGLFWTRTPPAGPLQSQIDLALNPAWGNTATQVTTIRVPAGTTIYEGFAAGQGGLVGGGSQVVLPNVNPEWIIR